MRGAGTGIRDQGSGKVKLWLALAAVVVAAVVAVFLLTRQDAASTVNAVSRRVSRSTTTTTATTATAASASHSFTFPDP